MPDLPDHVEVSKNAIRDHAMAFSKKWADASSESAERQLFWNDFFAIFGVSLKNVGFFEVAAERLSTQGNGWIDLLMPGRMAVEHKSAGKDLDAAMDQLLDYLPSLQPAAMPRLLIACNFQEFYWRDLEAHTSGRFPLQDLSKHVELFWWLAGHQEQDFASDEEEANLIATSYMAKLHDAMLSSGYDSHALREWLTRILFCLFADDTEVWDRHAFSTYLYLHTKADGSDLGSTLAYLFQILDTPENLRASNLDEDLATFTYINGDLFGATLPIPSCDEPIRDALLEACKFNWSAISPAIFGSMFQNVMTPAERRHLGAHYTTEENILKTIRPLFLDDLEAELGAIKITRSQQSRQALNSFHEKLAHLTFLDPACGCGNFLVIAYRELRRLEAEVLRKQAVREGKDAWQAIGLSLLCKVTVGQFYGIEIEEFPARIARTALYLMDHKANLDVSKEFGQYFARFPIPTSPHIRIDNALRMNWDALLPRDSASYVLGNPPFVGMSLMTADQQDDNRLVFGDGTPKALRTGRLDYVACWYEKFMQYAEGSSVRAAFVSTNSLFQGEQALTIGPLFARHGYEVEFAHTTFAWSSEAKGKAHVHCVIVGFGPAYLIRRKRLFEYATLTGVPIESSAKNINVYLADGPSVAIVKRSEPLTVGLPNATQGNKPTDGGHLIVTPEEVEAVRQDAIASKYLRRFVQSRDMLHGEERWCLWLVDASPAELNASPIIRERLRLVADWRRNKSKTATVQAAYTTPALFTQIRQPGSAYLAMPEVSSSSRRYIPGRFFGPDTIAGNKLIVFPGAEEWFFGLMHSLMWNVWIKAVSGRLKSDISFSPSIGYFTVPFPIFDEAAKSKLTPASQAILDARSAEPGASLADLYDPLSMPATLIKAHDELDRIVDSLFAPRKRLRSDADRLGVLFERYQALTSPLLATKVRRR